MSDSIRQPAPPSPTGSHFSARSDMDHSGLLVSQETAATREKSVSISTSPEKDARRIIPKPSTFTSAPSVVPKSMARLPASRISQTDSLPPHPIFERTPLIYPDLSYTIHLRPRSANCSDSDASIYSRIITPYHPIAFAHALNKHHITHEFPSLIKNLQHGFPVGEMPLLLSTIIIRNHPSVAEHPDAVQDYTTTELGMDRMSGPFTQQETERILRGPFMSSPLIVAIQDQGPDLPVKKRVCRSFDFRADHA